MTRTFHEKLDIEILTTQLVTPITFFRYFFRFNSRSIFVLSVQVITDSNLSGFAGTQQCYGVVSFTCRHQQNQRRIMFAQ